MKMGSRWKAAEVAILLVFVLAVAFTKLGSVPLEPTGQLTISEGEYLRTSAGERIAQKIQEDPAFETHFVSVEKFNELRVVFYHNAPASQPVQVELIENYALSNANPAPYENVTLVVPLVSGRSPHFRLRIGSSSEVFEFGQQSTFFPQQCASGEQELSLTKAGNGKGTVTSSPSGISCGVNCQSQQACFTNGYTTVDLTATAASDSVFSSWSGDCSGSGSCSVTMDVNRAVTATFTDVSTGPDDVSGPDDGTGVDPELLFNITAFDFSNNVSTCLLMVTETFPGTTQSNFTMTQNGTGKNVTCTYFLNSTAEPTIPDDGNFTWRVRVNDTVGNVNFTANRTFIFDNTPPNTTYLTIANNSVFNTTSNVTLNITINVTDNFGTNLSRLVIRNSTGNVVVNQTQNATVVNYPVTLFCGQHAVTTSASDDVGKESSDNTVTINVDCGDDDEPDDTTTGPDDNTKVDPELLFNITATDPTSNIDTCLLRVTETFPGSTVSNFTMTQNGTGRNVTCTYFLNSTAEPTIPEDGNFTWTVRINDSAGNVHFTENRSFIFDNTPPNATFISPQNNTSFNSTAGVNVTVNSTINVTDNFGTNLSRLVIRNSTGSTVFNQTKNATVVSYSSSLSCGSYTFTTSAGDDAGKESGDSTFTITVTCPVCGNSVVESGESCDPATPGTTSGSCPASANTCSASCTCVIECGNGVVESGEGCDDDNAVSGDGCSSSCAVEGYPTCGNGVIESGEQCDDGNTVSGDGCSSSCTTEPTDGGDGGCSTYCPENYPDGPLDAPPSEDADCTSAITTCSEGTTKVCCKKEMCTEEFKCVDPNGDDVPPGEPGPDNKLKVKPSGPVPQSGICPETEIACGQAAPVFTSGYSITSTTLQEKLEQCCVGKCEPDYTCETPSGYTIQEVGKPPEGTTKRTEEPACFSATVVSCDDTPPVPPADVDIAKYNALVAAAKNECCGCTEGYFCPAYNQIFFRQKVPPAQRTAAGMCPEVGPVPCGASISVVGVSPATIAAAYADPKCCKPPGSNFDIHFYPLYPHEAVLDPPGDPALEEGHVLITEVFIDDRFSDESTEESQELFSEGAPTGLADFLLELAESGVEGLPSDIGQLASIAVDTAESALEEAASTAELSALIEERRRLRDELSGLESRIESVQQRFQELQSVKDVFDRQDALSGRISSIGLDLANLLEEIDIARAEGFTEAIGDLEAKAEEAEKSLDEAKKELAGLSSQIAERGIVREDVEAEIESVVEEVRGLVQQASDIRQALLTLEEDIAREQGLGQGLEWFEIFNPTERAISLSNPAKGTSTYVSNSRDYWRAANAEGSGDFGLFNARFPGRTLGPHETITVAVRGKNVADFFGFVPDYEIIDSDPNIPDMMPAFPGSIGQPPFFSRRADTLVIYEWSGYSSAAQEIAAASKELASDIAAHVAAGVASDLPADKQEEVLRAVSQDVAARISRVAASKLAEGAAQAVPEAFAEEAALEGAEEQAESQSGEAGQEAFLRAAKLIAEPSAPADSDALALQVASAVSSQIKEDSLSKAGELAEQALLSLGEKELDSQAAGIVSAAQKVTNVDILSWKEQASSNEAEVGVELPAPYKPTVPLGPPPESFLSFEDALKEEESGAAEAVSLPAAAVSEALPAPAPSQAVSESQTEIKLPLTDVALSPFTGLTDEEVKAELEEIDKQILAIWEDLQSEERDLTAEELGLVRRRNAVSSELASRGLTIQPDPRVQEVIDRYNKQISAVVAAPGAEAKARPVLDRTYLVDTTLLSPTAVCGDPPPVKEGCQLYNTFECGQGKESCYDFDSDGCWYPAGCFPLEEGFTEIQQAADVVERPVIISPDSEVPPLFDVPEEQSRDAANEAFGLGEHAENVLGGGGAAAEGEEEKVQKFAIVQSWEAAAEQGFWTFETLENPYHPGVHHSAVDQGSEDPAYEPSESFQPPTSLEDSMGFQPQEAQCANLIDDDGDGATDTADSGCFSAFDMDERITSIQRKGVTIPRTGVPQQAGETAEVSEGTELDVSETAPVSLAEKASLILEGAGDAALQVVHSYENGEIGADTAITLLQKEGLSAEDARIVIASITPKLPEEEQPAQPATGAVTGLRLPGLPSLSVTGMQAAPEPEQLCPADYFLYGLNQATPQGYECTASTDPQYKCCRQPDYCEEGYTLYPGTQFSVPANYVCQPTLITHPQAGSRCCRALTDEDYCPSGYRYFSPQEPFTPQGYTCTSVLETAPVVGIGHRCCKAPAAPEPVTACEEGEFELPATSIISASVQCRELPEKGVKCCQLPEAAPPSAEAGGERAELAECEKLEGDEERLKPGEANGKVTGPVTKPEDRKQHRETSESWSSTFEEGEITPGQADCKPSRPDADNNDMQNAFNYFENIQQNGEIWKDDYDDALRFNRVDVTNAHNDALQALKKAKEDGHPGVDAVEGNEIYSKSRIEGPILSRLMHVDSVVNEILALANLYAHKMTDPQGKKAAEKAKEAREKADKFNNAYGSGDLGEAQELMYEDLCSEYTAIESAQAEACTALEKASSASFEDQQKAVNEAKTKLEAQLKDLEAAMQNAQRWADSAASRDEAAKAQTALDKAVGDLAKARADLDKANADPGGYFVDNVLGPLIDKCNELSGKLSEAGNSFSKQTDAQPDECKKGEGEPKKTIPQPNLKAYGQGLEAQAAALEKLAQDIKDLTLEDMEQQLNTKLEVTEFIKEVEDHIDQAFIACKTIEDNNRAWPELVDAFHKHCFDDSYFPALIAYIEALARGARAESLLSTGPPDEFIAAMLRAMEILDAIMQMWAFFGDAVKGEENAQGDYIAAVWYNPSPAAGPGAVATGAATSRFPVSITGQQVGSGGFLPGISPGGSTPSTVEEIGVREPELPAPERPKPEDVPGIKKDGSTVAEQPRGASIKFFSALANAAFQNLLKKLGIIYKERVWEKDGKRCIERAGACVEEKEYEDPNQAKADPQKIIEDARAGLEEDNKKFKEQEEKIDKVRQERQQKVGWELDGIHRENNMEVGPDGVPRLGGVPATLGEDGYIYEINPDTGEPIKRIGVVSGGGLQADRYRDLLQEDASFAKRLDGLINGLKDSEGNIVTPGLKQLADNILGTPGQVGSLQRYRNEVIDKMSAIGIRADFDDKNRISFFSKSTGQPVQFINGKAYIISDDYKDIRALYSDGSVGPRVVFDASSVPHLVVMEPSAFRAAQQEMLRLQKALKDAQVNGKEDDIARIAEQLVQGVGGLNIRIDAGYYQNGVPITIDPSGVAYDPPPYTDLPKINELIFKSKFDDASFAQLNNRLLELNLEARKILDTSGTAVERIKIFVKGTDIEAKTIAKATFLGKQFADLLRLLKDLAMREKLSKFTGEEAEWLKGTIRADIERARTPGDLQAAMQQAYDLGLWSEYARGAVKLSDMVHDAAVIAAARQEMEAIERFFCEGGRAPDPGTCSEARRGLAKIEEKVKELRDAIDGAYAGTSTAAGFSDVAETAIILGQWDKAVDGVRLISQYYSGKNAAEGTNAIRAIVSSLKDAEAGYLSADLPVPRNLKNAIVIAEDELRKGQKSYLDYVGTAVDLKGVAERHDTDEIDRTIIALDTLKGEDVFINALIDRIKARLKALFDAEIKARESAAGTPVAKAQTQKAAKQAAEFIFIELALLDPDFEAIADAAIRDLFNKMKTAEDAGQLDLSAEYRARMTAWMLVLSQNDPALADKFYQNAVKNFYAAMKSFADAQRVSNREAMEKNQRRISELFEQMQQLHFNKQLAKNPFLNQQQLFLGFANAMLNGEEGREAVLTLRIGREASDLFGQLQEKYTRAGMSLDVLRTIDPEGAKKLELLNNQAGMILEFQKALITQLRAVFANVDLRELPLNERDRAINALIDLSSVVNNAQVNWLNANKDFIGINEILRPLIAVGPNVFQLARAAVYGNDAIAALDQHAADILSRDAETRAGQNDNFQFFIEQLITEGTGSYTDFMPFEPFIIMFGRAHSAFDAFRTDTSQVFFPGFAGGFLRIGEDEVSGLVSVQAALSFAIGGPLIGQAVRGLAFLGNLATKIPVLRVFAIGLKPVVSGAFRVVTFPFAIGNGVQRGFEWAIRSLARQEVRALAFGQTGRQFLLGSLRNVVQVLNLGADFVFEIGFEEVLLKNFYGSAFSTGLGPLEPHDAAEMAAGLTGGGRSGRRVLQGVLARNGIDSRQITIVSPGTKPWEQELARLFPAPRVGAYGSGAAGSKHVIGVKQEDLGRTLRVLGVRADQVVPVKETNAQGQEVVVGYAFQQNGLISVVLSTSSQEWNSVKHDKVTGTTAGVTEDGFAKLYRIDGRANIDNIVNGLEASGQLADGTRTVEINRVPVAPGIYRGTQVLPNGQRVTIYIVTAGTPIQALNELGFFAYENIRAYELMGDGRKLLDAERALKVITVKKLGILFTDQPGIMIEELHADTDLSPEQVAAILEQSGLFEVVIVDGTKIVATHIQTGHTVIINTDGKLSAPPADPSAPATKIGGYIVVNANFPATLFDIKSFLLATEHDITHVQTRENMAILRYIAERTGEARNDVQVRGTREVPAGSIGAFPVGTTFAFVTQDGTQVPATSETDPVTGETVYRTDRPATPEGTLHFADEAASASVAQAASDAAAANEMAADVQSMEVPQAMKDRAQRAALAAVDAVAAAEQAAEEARTAGLNERVQAAQRAQDAARRAELARREAEAAFAEASDFEAQIPVAARDARSAADEAVEDASDAQSRADSVGSQNVPQEMKDRAQAAAQKASEAAAEALRETRNAENSEIENDPVNAVLAARRAEEARQRAEEALEETRRVEQEALGFASEVQTAVERSERAAKNARTDADLAKDWADDLDTLNVPQSFKDGARQAAERAELAARQAEASAERARAAQGTTDSALAARAARVAEARAEAAEADAERLWESAQTTEQIIQSAEQAASRSAFEANNHRIDAVETAVDIQAMTVPQEMKDRALAAAARAEAASVDAAQAASDAQQAADTEAAVLAARRAEEAAERAEQASKEVDAIFSEASALEAEIATAAQRAGKSAEGAQQLSGEAQQELSVITNVPQEMRARAQAAADAASQAAAEATVQAALAAQKAGEGDRVGSVLAARRAEEARQRAEDSRNDIRLIRLEAQQFQALLMSVPQRSRRAVRNAETDASIAQDFANDLSLINAPSAILVAAGRVAQAARSAAIEAARAAENALLLAAQGSPDAVAAMRQAEDAALRAAQLGEEVEKIWNDAQVLHSQEALLDLMRQLDVASVQAQNVVLTSVVSQQCATCPQQVATRPDEEPGQVCRRLSPARNCGKLFGVELEDLNEAVLRDKLGVTDAQASDIGFVKQNAFSMHSRLMTELVLAADPSLSPTDVEVRDRAEGTNAFGDASFSYVIYVKGVPTLKVSWLVGQLGERVLYHTEIDIFTGRGNRLSSLAYELDAQLWKAMPALHNFDVKSQLVNPITARLFAKTYFGAIKLDEIKANEPVGYKGTLQRIFFFGIFGSAGGKNDIDSEGTGRLFNRQSETSNKDLVRANMRQTLSEMRRLGGFGYDAQIVFMQAALAGFKAEDYSALLEEMKYQGFSDAEIQEGINALAGLITRVDAALKSSDPRSVIPTIDPARAAGELAVLRAGLEGIRTAQAPAADLTHKEELEYEESEESAQTSKHEPQPQAAITGSSPENYLTAASQAEQASDSLTPAEQAQFRQQQEGFARSTYDTGSHLSPALVVERALNRVLSPQAEGRHTMGVVTMPIAAANSAGGHAFGDRIKAEVQRIVESVLAGEPTSLVSPDGSFRGFLGTRLVVAGITPAQVQHILVRFEAYKDSLILELQALRAAATDPAVKGLLEVQIRAVRSMRLSIGTAQMDFNAQYREYTQATQERRGQIADEIEQNVVNEIIPLAVGLADAAEATGRSSLVSSPDGTITSESGTDITQDEDVQQAVEGGISRSIPMGQYNRQRTDDERRAYGRAPRETHDLGRLAGPQADSRLTELMDAIASANPEAIARAKEAYLAALEAYYQGMWKDGRNKELWKRALLSQLVALDQSGFASRIFPGESGFYMMRVGDEFILLYKVEGKLRATFIEIDKFNAFNKLYPPQDAADPIVNAIAEAMVGLASELNVKGGLTAAQARGFLESVNRRLAAKEITFKKARDLRAADGSEIFIEVTRNGQKIRTSRVEPGDVAAIGDLRFQPTVKGVIGGKPARIPQWIDAKTNEVYSTAAKKDSADRPAIDPERGLGVVHVTVTSGHNIDVTPDNIEDVVRVLDNINAQQKELAPGSAVDASELLPEIPITGRQTEVRKEDFNKAFRSRLSGLLAAFAKGEVSLEQLRNMAEAAFALAGDNKLDRALLDYVRSFTVSDAKRAELNSIIGALGGLQKPGIEEALRAKTQPPPAAPAAAPLQEGFRAFSSIDSLQSVTINTPSGPVVIEFNQQTKEGLRRLLQLSKQLGDVEVSGFILKSGKVVLPTKIFRLTGSIPPGLRSISELFTEGEIGLLHKDTLLAIANVLAQTKPEEAAAIRAKVDQDQQLTQGEIALLAAASESIGWHVISAPAQIGVLGTFRSSVEAENPNDPIAVEIHNHPPYPDGRPGVPEPSVADIFSLDPGEIGLVVGSREDVGIWQTSAEQRRAYEEMRESMNLDKPTEEASEAARNYAASFLLAVARYGPSAELNIDPLRYERKLRELENIGLIAEEPADQFSAIDARALLRLKVATELMARGVPAATRVDPFLQAHRAELERAPIGQAALTEDATVVDFVTARITLTAEQHARLTRVVTKIRAEGDAAAVRSELAALGFRPADIDFFISEVKNACKSCPLPGPLASSIIDKLNAQRDAEGDDAVAGTRELRSMMLRGIALEYVQFFAGTSKDLQDFFRALEAHLERTDLTAEERADIENMLAELGVLEAKPPQPSVFSIVRIDDQTTQAFFRNTELEIEDASAIAEQAAEDEIEGLTGEREDLPPEGRECRSGSPVVDFCRFVYRTTKRLLTSEQQDAATRSAARAVAAAAKPPIPVEKQAGFIQLPISSLATGVVSVTVNTIDGPRTIAANSKTAESMAEGKRLSRKFGNVEILQVLLADGSAVSPDENRVLALKTDAIPGITPLTFDSFRSQFGEAVPVSRVRELLGAIQGASLISLAEQTDPAIADLLKRGGTVDQLTESQVRAMARAVSLYSWHAFSLPHSSQALPGMAAKTELSGTPAGTIHNHPGGTAEPSAGDVLTLGDGPHIVYAGDNYFAWIQTPQLREKYEKVYQRISTDPAFAKNFFLAIARYGPGPEVKLDEKAYESRRRLYGEQPLSYVVPAQREFRKIHARALDKLVLAAENLGADADIAIAAEEGDFGLEFGFSQVKSGFRSDVATAFERAARGEDIGPALSDPADRAIASILNLKGLGDKVILIASGSYGRSRVALHSDHDMMIVRKDGVRLPADLENSIVSDIIALGITADLPLGTAFLPFESGVISVFENLEATKKRQFLTARYVSGPKEVFDHIMAEVNKKIGADQDLEDFTVKDIRARAGIRANLDTELNVKKEINRRFDFIRWTARIYEAGGRQFPLSGEEMQRLVDDHNFFIEVRNQANAHAIDLGLPLDVLSPQNIAKLAQIRGIDEASFRAQMQQRLDNLYAMEAKVLGALQ